MEVKMCRLKERRKKTRSGWGAEGIYILHKHASAVILSYSLLFTGSKLF